MLLIMGALWIWGSPTGVSSMLAERLSPQRRGAAAGVAPEAEAGQLRTVRGLAGVAARAAAAAKARPASSKQLPKVEEGSKPFPNKAPQPAPVVAAPPVVAAAPLIAARPPAAAAPAAPAAGAGEDGVFCSLPQLPAAVDSADDERVAALASERGLAPLAWDSSAAWGAARLAQLRGVACHAVDMTHGSVRLPWPMHICTHDPTQDEGISQGIHQYHWPSMGTGSHEYMLAAGHALEGTTPLTSEDARALRAAGAAAAAAGTPRTLPALVAAAGLAPPPALAHAACSRERPFVLDLGGNIGLFTLVAANAGCSVVAVEPTVNNAGVLWQSVLKNGFEDRVTLFKNAVGLDERLIVMLFNERNSGGSFTKIIRGVKSERTVDSGDVVRSIILDDLFDGSEGRPRHPFTGAPIAPTDISYVKIDVERYDAVAMQAGRRFLEQGRPPLLMVEFDANAWATEQHGSCSIVRLMRWLYSLGYSTYNYDVGRPITLEEWERDIIPGIKPGQGLPPGTTPEQAAILRPQELFLVHKLAKVRRGCERGEGRAAPYARGRAGDSNAHTCIHTRVHRRITLTTPLLAGAWYPEGRRARRAGTSVRVGSARMGCVWG